MTENSSETKQVKHLNNNSTRHRALIAILIVAICVFFIVDSFTTQYAMQLVNLFITFISTYNIFIIFIVFLMVTTLSVICVFPIGILGLSGGYLFGSKLGFLFGFIIASYINVTGTVLGCVVTFRISKYIYGNTTDIHPMLKGVKTALEKKGRQINILLRLTPFFPAAVLNYALPLLGTKLDDFLIGSFLGSLPYAMLMSMLGAMLTQPDSIKHFFYHTSLSIVISLSASLIGLLIFIVYMTYKYATEALKEATQDEEDQKSLLHEDLKSHSRDHEEP